MYLLFQIVKKLGPGRNRNILDISRCSLGRDVDGPARIRTGVYGSRSHKDTKLPHGPKHVGGIWGGFGLVRCIPDAPAGPL